MTELAEKQIAWLLMAANYAGDECLIWPFYRLKGGYGKTARISGVQHLAHRWICKRVNGAPPSPKHEASHSCGMGHLGCCTPGHLDWKTHSENALERRAHGTSWQGNNKLQPADVKRLRSLRNSKTQRAIAKDFNISQANVSIILSGKGWPVHTK